MVEVRENDPTDLYEAIVEAYTGDATLALQQGRIWFDEDSLDARKVLAMLKEKRCESI
jgi:hypothetical protein